MLGAADPDQHLGRFPHDLKPVPAAYPRSPSCSPTKPPTTQPTGRVTVPTSALRTCVHPFPAGIAQPPEASGTTTRCRTPYSQRG